MAEIQPPFKGSLVAESFRTSHIDGLCRETPRSYLVLTPDLTIIDASQAYRRATLLSSEEIRGCGMFDVFPDNPHHSAADGVSNLRASFDHVLQHGMSHRMPLQRYDVRDRVAGDGVWVEKYWAPMNSPVFGSGSREITHVLHEVTDVTQALFLDRCFEEQELVLAEERATLDRMRQHQLHREGKLRAARKVLTRMLQRGTIDERWVDARLPPRGVPDARRYRGPGERAPVSGFYNVFHQGACLTGRSIIYMRADAVFATCRHCSNGVLYRLSLVM